MVGPDIAGHEIVARRSGSLTFAASSLARRGAYAHTAVQTIGLTVLVGITSPAKQNLLARMIEIHFSLPRGAKKTFPVRFVHDGDDATTSANGLV